MMARFDTSGLDDIIDAMAALDLLESEVADKMLMAGAEVVKQSWRVAAGMHGLKWSGDMIESIGFARKPKMINGIKTIDIYPQGKDKRGVRNAEKAFIHHYGSSRHKATHWVDDADEMSAEPVTEAMAGVYFDYLKEKELI
jgi:hypothetical protein